MSTRRVVQVVTWLVSLVVATALGMTAVAVVGEAARGRGPLGQAVTAPRDATPSSTPAGPPVRRTLARDFGTFTVSCSGPVARGLAAVAARAPGPTWRVVRFERGPDDDVAAVFRSDTERATLQVFCNRGRPTVAELVRAPSGGF